jgi:hypothetical protein
MIMILEKIHSKDEGFGREVGRIIERSAARKLLLVLPPLRRSQIRKRWDYFCTHFGIGTRSIPELPKSARLITFTDDWKPRMACAPVGWLAARSPGLARAYTKTLSEILATNSNWSAGVVKPPDYAQRAREGAVIGGVVGALPLLFLALFGASAETVLSPLLLGSPVVMAVAMSIAWMHWERPPDEN